MSMLSAQMDKLRAMAESVGLAMPQAATLMMEAADTIWELRDIVHRERTEADRLRNLLLHMYECMSNVDADGNHECYSCEYEGRECDFARLLGEHGIEVG